MSIEAEQESLVAEVLGITEPANEEQSFDETAHTLGYCGCVIDEDQFTAAQDSAEPTRLQREMDLDYRIFKGILRRDSLQANSLTNWPTYHRLIERYGAKGDGSAKALMIGAIGAIAARSFVCLAQSEYGANQAYIVDLTTTVTKARHGTFIQASGLDLPTPPFESGSMDFVHTNHLLYDLQDPSSESSSQEQMALDLFREIARVLAPGGQLLMKERLITLDKNWGPLRTLLNAKRFGRFVTRALAQYGITDVKIAPNKQPQNLDFLFDSQRDFSSYPTEKNPATIEIYARK